MVKSQSNLVVDQTTNPIKSLYQSLRFGENKARSSNRNWSMIWGIKFYKDNCFKFLLIF